MQSASEPLFAAIQFEAVLFILIEVGELDWLSIAISLNSPEPITFVKAHIATLVVLDVGDLFDLGHKFVEHTELLEPLIEI